MELPLVPEWRVYKQRWHILFIFSLQNIANASLCFTFAPISNKSSDFFGLGDFAVTALSWVFLLSYAPGSILAEYMIIAMDYRRAFVVGGILTAVASILRVLSAVSIRWLDWNPVLSFSIMVLGQILGGISQPFFFNGPGMISSTWFPISERDVVTAVGSMTNPVGNALGQLLPSLIVVSKGSRPISEEIVILVAIQCFLCLVSLAWTLAFYSAAPPSPPSASAAYRKAHFHDLDGNDGILQIIYRKNMAILENQDFRILLFCFGLGLALFNAFLALIGIVVDTYGFSDSDSGIFGSVLIFAGIVGAGIVGVYLEFSHHYNGVLKLFFMLTVSALVLLFISLELRSYLLTLTSFALLGFCMLPTMPAAIESAAECTFPASEEDSTGLLLTAGNTFAVPLIIVLHLLIDMDSGSIKPLSGLSIFVVLLGIGLVVCILRFNGEYKRSLMDQCEDPRNAVVDGRHLECSLDASMSR